MVYQNYSSWTSSYRGPWIAGGEGIQIKCLRMDKSHSFRHRPVHWSLVRTGRRSASFCRWHPYRLSDLTSWKPCPSGFDIDPKQVPRQRPGYAPASTVLEAPNFRIVREKRFSLERKSPPIRPNSSESGFSVNFFLGSWGCYAPYKSYMCVEQSSPQ